MTSCVYSGVVFFLFMQKTAYEMRISDWSSDVCSSDLLYVVYQASDQVIEAAGEGRDRIRTAASNYTLGANVEELVYTGTIGATMTGNALDNFVVGRSEERRVGQECVSTCLSRWSP